MTRSLRSAAALCGLVALALSLVQPVRALGCELGFGDHEHDSGELATEAHSEMSGLAHASTHEAPVANAHDEHVAEDGQSGPACPFGSPAVMHGCTGSLFVASPLPPQRPALVHDVAEASFDLAAPPAPFGPAPFHPPRA